MLAIAELISDPKKSQSRKLLISVSHFNTALKEVQEKEGFYSC